MIQSIITALIVLAAAAWLLRRGYFTIRAAVRGETDQLGRCGSCSRNPANEKAPVIELGIARPASAKRNEIR